MLRMLKNLLPLAYQRKLARPLTLADGTTLVTLRDVAKVLFDAANTSSGARSPNWVADDSGGNRTRSDIAAATDAVERALVRPGSAVTGRRRDVDGRRGTLRATAARSKLRWRNFVRQTRRAAT